MTYAILLVLCAFSSVQANTIRILARIGVDEVTFDPGRVSALEVRRWIQLSPIVGGDNGYLVPEVLEQCPLDDPRYVGCGKEQESVNFHNAQLNLDKIRQRIRDLDSDHYPADLKDVVLYIRRIQSFWLWRETQRLAFVKSADLAALESEFEEINPKLTCREVLDRIRNAKSPAETFQLVRVDWSNCMWHAEQRQVGEYPQSTWEKFLADHGIREHYIEEEVDD